MNPARLVVDASVVIKWLLPEPDRELALGVLQGFLTNETSLVAPRLLVAEVGNVLWKRSRRGHFTAESLLVVFDQFLLNCPILLDSPGLNRAALRLAMSHSQTMYDCLYLALALELGCDCVTADDRFYRVMSPSYSCIRLLGNRQSPRGGSSPGPANGAT